MSKSPQNHGYSQVDLSERAQRVQIAKELRMSQPHEGRPESHLDHI